jgi:hypothetical protein
MFNFLFKKSYFIHFKAENIEEKKRKKEEKRRKKMFFF